MKTSSPPSSCHGCGQPIPQDAPLGLCPRCLLQSSPSSADSAGNATGHPPVPGPATPRIPPPPADIAAFFPQLEILELLGQGGMGVVYKARQPRLDRRVAVKILPAERAADPTFVERFTREARALAKISHPGIVTLHDFGNAGPYLYLMMEYVDGASLRQVIEAGRVPTADALAWVVRICEALQYAHDRGVVHRDIKPGNILVDRSGQVKIADFGLAKLVEPGPGGAGLTAEHQVMGTPHYMAPEQMTNPIAVDHRADIYSLGVVFYEMLTGQLPVGRFPPPSHQRPAVDARVDPVVLRTLEQEPGRRYQHARDVKTDVENLGAAGPAPVPPSTPPPPPAPALPPPSALSPFAAFRRALASGKLTPLTKAIHVVLSAIYLLGMLWFFSASATSTPTSLRRQVGAPTPWIHWEASYVLGQDGTTFGVHFPAWSWAVAGIALAAYSLHLRLLRTRRPLRWTDVQFHYALWIVLAVAAIAFTAAPLFPSRTAVIREVPPKPAHVAGELRTSSYSIDAPPNHRLNLWIEWWEDGRQVTRPGHELDLSILPARNLGVRGVLDLHQQLAQAPAPGNAPDGGVEWQWLLRGPGLQAGGRGKAGDPFAGLPFTDSTFGRQATRRLREGEDAPLLVLRGDRRPLDTPPGNPARPGGSAVEMRLMASIARVLPSFLGTFPTITTNTPARPASRSAGNAPAADPN